MEKYLEEIGEFGSYQIRNSILLSLPTIIVAMQKYAWVFLAAKVNHRCKLEWEDGNVSYFLSNEELNLYYPKDPKTYNGFSQCKIYSIYLHNSSLRLFHPTTFRRATK